MPRTLILGGGFGGIAVATELRRLAGPGHEIVLVDRREHFMMGLRKLWATVGAATLEEGQRSREQLAAMHGIDVKRCAIEQIGAEARSVTTDSGQLDGDRLVVALGVEPRPDLVPGLGEHAHDVWDTAGVRPLRDALSSFGGGTIAIVIAGGPYTCPPAPFELVLLLDEHLRMRELRDETRLVLSTFQPMLMPNAGREGSDWLAAVLDERGIEHRCQAQVREIESGRILYQDAELQADLIIGVPPHRPPAVVSDSALTGASPFIPVDRATLQTPVPGVWAVGDVTQIMLANGMPLPKAGVVAELEGKVVAGQIAAELAGTDAAVPFEGRAWCFIEMGLSSATRFDADFFAEPAPSIQFQDISEEHAAEKHRFEEDHLRAWFGA